MQEKESKPLQKWKLWTGLTVLFLSGVLIGALSTGLFMAHGLERSLHQGEPGVRRLVLKRLVRDLKLTESQKASAEKIVCRAQTELRRLRQSHRPELEEVVGRAVTELKTELTPEQQKKLDALHEKIRQRWQSHGKSSGKAKPNASDCD